MNTKHPNGFSEENLVMFPAAKNFKINPQKVDPLEELLSEFSQYREDDLPFDIDEHSIEENFWDEEVVFHSLDAFMNRSQIGDVPHPDDKLVKLIRERLTAIREAKEKIKFYLDEIEMFMPKRR